MAFLQSTIRPLLSPKVYNQAQKHNSHSKDAGVLFTILVHQYGGVETAVIDLVTWVKTIYSFAVNIYWSGLSIRLT